MSACGGGSIWGRKGNELKITRTNCKRWTCDHCGPIRTKRLKAYARSGLPNTFMTLTARYGNADTPDAAARRLVVAFRLLRQQLKRDGLAEHISFFAVFETTKKGWPHLHILMRAPFLPQERISQLMEKWNDSPVVDIRRIESAHKAAAYVAKYVAKAPSKFKGTKRYWAAQDYIVSKKIYDPHPTPDRQWHFEPTVLELMHRAFEAEGLELISAGPNCIVMQTPNAFDDLDVENQIAKHRWHPPAT